MSPTEQLRQIASRIEGMRGINESVDALIDRIEEASPIVVKRLAELKRERKERAAELERRRKEALPYIDALPDTMNKHELDRFETMISDLPTEELVRRRNAQNCQWRPEIQPPWRRKFQLLWFESGRSSRASALARALPKWLARAKALRPARAGFRRRD